MNKQVEEMAVIGCVRNPQAHIAEECAKCDFKNGQCNSYRQAEALYNTGYRKIPKDSVVLSREEQERILTATEKRIKELKRQILQARKETAEKIFTELLKEKELIDLGCGDGTYEYIAVDDLKDLAKQYSIEIKE